MNIDHIGYAVKDIDKSKRLFEFLGFIFEELIEDNDRNIYLQFGKRDGYKIELVAPMKGESPVDGYLNTVGVTPYHICYCSENLQEDIKKLEKENYKVLIPKKRAKAFGGRHVVFLIHRNMGLIEIVEAK